MSTAPAPQLGAVSIVAAPRRRGVEGHSPLPGLGLGLPDENGPADLHDLLGNGQVPAVEVDVGPPRPDGLAPAQASLGDQVVDRIEPLCRCDVEEGAGADVGVAACANRTCAVQPAAVVTLRARTVPGAPRVVAGTVDRATAGRQSGPILLNRAGRRMDRHGATRRLHHLADTAGAPPRPPATHEPADRVG